MRKTNAYDNRRVFFKYQIIALLTFVEKFSKAVEPLSKLSKVKIAVSVESEFR